MDNHNMFHKLTTAKINPHTHQHHPPPGVQIRWSNLPPICVEASQTQYTIQQQNSDAQKNSMLSRQQLREMEHW